MWEYSKMRRLGVEVSSPTPKTRCKILLLPHPAGLVSLLSAKPRGVKALPWASPGPKTSPKRAEGWPDTHAIPPRHPERVPAQAGIKAGTLEQIPDRQEIRHPGRCSGMGQPSRGSAPRQRKSEPSSYGAEQLRHPPPRRRLQGLCSTRSHLHQGLKFS